MVSEAECPRAWARSQPKCELHRHLEGAIRGADLLAALRDWAGETVLLAGWPDTQNVWRPICNELDTRCVCLCLPGYEEHSRPEGTRVGRSSR